MDHAAVDYLEAKRTVDERALSPRVREALLAALPAAPRILEAGAGTGVTVPRLVEWGVTAGSYHGVDRSEKVLAFARDRRTTELDAEPNGNGFVVEDLDVRFEQGDALEAFDTESADLVVAAAFLDLVPIEAAFDAFERALRPGGLVYAPLTFDGGTVFQPDHPADDAIETAYHEAIDAEPGRDAHAGRHLLDHLREREGQLLAVAASDWIVRPQDGRYPADERRFLASILEFVAEAVEDRPNAEEWLATRREQLEAGRLSYAADQYDFLYRVPEP